MNLPQRLRDWLLERRIAAAQDEIDRLDRPTSNDTWAYVKWIFSQDYIDALKAQRSPQQLARMAKGQG